jgi:hypothetical protein
MIARRIGGVKLDAHIDEICYNRAMTLQLLTRKGTKYVLLKEKDFRRLERQLQQALQDIGDLAEAERSRKSGPLRPYAELRKKLLDRK